MDTTEASVRRSPPPRHSLTHFLFLSPAHLSRPLTRWRALPPHCLSLPRPLTRSLPPPRLWTDGILFVAVGIYTVLSSPLLLLGLSLLAGAWADAFVLTSPETPITIAGFELRRREKLFALAPFSILVVTLCGLINSIVWCVLLTVLLALPHASFHEVTPHSDDENSRPAHRAPHSLPSAAQHLLTLTCAHTGGRDGCPRRTRARRAQGSSRCQCLRGVGGAGLGR